MAKGQRFSMLTMQVTRFRNGGGGYIGTLSTEVQAYVLAANLTSWEIAEVLIDCYGV